MTSASAATADGRRIARADLTEQLVWIGFSLTSAYAAILFAAWLQGLWLSDPQSRPLVVDFLNVYAAGTMVLDGNAAAAYDWTLHKHAEVKALGRPFEGYLGWHYPPMFLFIAGLLALLPLIPATLVWTGLTLFAYVLAIRAIVSSRAAVLLALGFPAVVWNAYAGQNGFLTAALVGGSLALLERRPVAAGVLLGLLTYKPQFGLLFPLALACGGHWRAIAAAIATATAVAAASYFAFGAESWLAFVAWMPAMTDAVFGQGRVGLNKLQTLLGLARWLGSSMTMAWALQAILMAACAGLVTWIWRSATRFEVKAAALSVSALLATPYLFVYDLVVLAVPMAFIVRLGLHDGFLPLELAGLSAAALLVLAFPITGLPTGLIAVVIVAATVCRRLGIPRLESA
jgi:arabinofuranan 3-O-arabinosyltransferase